ncbi:SpaA isopeptide-forming pilin-related protein [uncultured Eubacterium sp.]|uniref:SpaA isopeptide-forming pilin-related protein n=1 Tax=uncultured Eubacterium sp. TaxID=165185 RepID=UPI0028063D77|nr:SpaA isopeptide-forming pilin-related protein [uncultured Eubacterium sp.]
MISKIKNFSFWKRLTSMLLALLVVLTVFPIHAFAEDTNLGKVSGASKIDVTAEMNYGHEIHWGTVGGKNYPLFCIEYGATSPDSSYLAGKKAMASNNALEAARWIFAGYYMEHGNAISKKDMAMCQKKVWSIMGDSTSWNFSDSDYKEWCDNAKANMKKLNTYPSFDGKNIGNLVAGASKTVTDTNKVLCDYPAFTYTKNKVTVKHEKDKNTLTISVDKDCTATSFALPATKYFKEYTGDDDELLLYYPYGSKSYQKLIYSAYYDPIDVSFNADITPLGNLKLIKTSEDNVVANIKFTITGTNYSKTVTTNSKGEFQLDDLVPGKYTVTEESIDKYVPAKSQTVTVEGNKTATVSFSNVLKRSDIKVIKSCEDNFTEGHKFHLYGTSLSGIKVDEYTTTDKNGVATFKDILIGTGYTLEEVDTAVRYVIPDNQTAAVEWNKVNEYHFNNKLKKFRVTVTKTDVEKGHAQGDGTLAGASYGLYKGSTLVDTYYTDEIGQFTTKYYVCDTDWTIKEISASEGYLINDEVYKVGADPKLYEIEYNECKNAVTEQVKKGKIAIIKHTDDGSTQIETPEKGAEFQVYLKSAGSFVNADKDEKDTIICDEDGFASTKLLPYGVYTVHQTKGWEGREKIKDFDVFIDTDMKEYKFLINNSNFESYLKVVKLDAETGKQIAYEGAGFEIYDSNNHRISMQFTYPEVTEIHTFYTNSEGYLITPEKLPYGDYTLKEVQAPYGYVLDFTPIPFSITQENSSTDTGVTVVKVKAKDMSQKGVIEITKTGEIFKSVIENEGIYTPIYENSNLANAVFEIYAAEDITTLDGTTRCYKGEKIDEITTDKNGIAKSKQLYLGKYTVIEKTAPDTFVNANEQYDVELTYAGQNVTVTSTAFSVFNDRQKVSVSLLKELSKDERFKLGMNDEILSVQFGIYADEDITAADETVIPKDALITYGNCDENGNLTFNCDLPIGFKWYAKEIATDSHYILSDTRYTFDTEYKGQNVETIKIDLNSGQKIENNLIYGTIKGLKIDRETEKTIEGTLFGLFKSDTTEYTKDNAILTAESDENGIFIFDNIPFGNYVIKELKPAENYLPSDDIHHITVSENEQLIEITAVNDRIPELKTTATIDGEKEVTAKGEITIDDVVEYKHLVLGKEYKIVGTLIDKATDKPFEIDGKLITSEVIFTPEKSNGKVTVSLTFDASAIKETTELVVFETVYRDNVEIAVHADIDDEGQTVKINVPAPEKPSTPKTGDERNYDFWIGLGCIAVGGIVAGVILKIKSKKDEDNE